jgi:hypothetical protein
VAQVVPVAFSRSGSAPPLAVPDNSQVIVLVVFQVVVVLLITSPTPFLKLVGLLLAELAQSGRNSMGGNFAVHPESQACPYRRESG